MDEKVDPDEAHQSQRQRQYIEDRGNGRAPEFPEAESKAMGEHFLFDP